MKCAFIGTSITTGNGAGTGTNGHDGAGPLCFVSKAKDALRTAGKNARTDSWFADHKILVAQIGTYDTRVVVGDTAAWGPTGTGAQNTLGGDRYRNNTNANATAMQMTPTFAWNSVDFYDIALSGGPVNAIQLSLGGTLSAGVPTGETNLGAVVSQSNATTIYRKTNRTSGAGAAVQAFNAKRVDATTATCYVLAWDLWDSANLDIALYNMGQAGATSAVLAQNANPYNPMAAIGTVAPNVVFIEATTNDIKAATPVATTQANILSMITACKAAGASVVLCTSPPLATASATEAFQLEHRSGVIALAAANDCAVVDFYRLFVNRALMVANSYAADNDHPNAAGHALMSVPVSNLLLAG